MGSDGAMAMAYSYKDLIIALNLTIYTVNILSPSSQQQLRVTPRHLQAHRMPIS